MTAVRADLRELVKAYDVRGTVPDQLDETVAAALGAAFADVTGASRIVLAHDMRESGPGLLAAFAEGAAARGARSVNAGLASTDLLYYASGKLGLAAAMFTASHNPARYNGIKLCRAGAVPVGAETGLNDIRDRAAHWLSVGVPRVATTCERISLLAEYSGYLRTLVDLSSIRPLHVVVDAGNGMGGYTAPAVLGGEVLAPLPVKIEPLYFELDGTFPNHEANPLDPANLVDLQARVVEVGADIGLAFDGDADRCFVVDSSGAAVSPSAITALIATRELRRSPGATVIHNVITSKAVPEIIRESGGIALRTRVGHSYIKAEMAAVGAVFGGEHSAHYYFRDFWFADTGMLAAMHVLAALGEQDGTLQDLVSRFTRYAASGEINSEVVDAPSRVRALEDAFRGRCVGRDDLDGVTLDLTDGAWLNVRSSNTEPLLRLNVEAATTARMQAIRDEALAVIRA